MTVLVWKMERVVKFSTLTTHDECDTEIFMNEIGSWSEGNF